MCFFWSLSRWSRAHGSPLRGSSCSTSVSVGAFGQRASNGCFSVGFAASQRARKSCSNLLAVHFIRVARLQNEVGTKDFFRGTNFLTKNAPKFSPIFLSLYFMGRKKSRKIPAKFPTKFPSPKSKKNSPTSFCRGSHANILSIGILFVCSGGRYWPPRRSKWSFSRAHLLVQISRPPTCGGLKDIRLKDIIFVVWRLKHGLRSISSVRALSTLLKILWSSGLWEAIVDTGTVGVSHDQQRQSCHTDMSTRSTEEELVLELGVCFRGCPKPGFWGTCVSRPVFVKATRFGFLGLFSLRKFLYIWVFPAVVSGVVGLEGVKSS